MTTKTLHATHHLDVRGRGRRRRPHPRAARPLGDATSSPKYRDRALRFVIDDDGLEALEIGGKPSMLSRRGSPSVLGAMGDPDLRAIQLDPERTYLARGALRVDGPRRAARAARRRGHRRRGPLHDRRAALGGRAGRPRAEPGLHARLQPVDLRVLCRPRPAGAHRAPLARRSGGGGRRAGAGRGGGGEGRLRLPVHPRRSAARASRQRPGVRRRPGPRRPVRHPPHLRAAVDEGHAHGRLGERPQAAAPRLGHRVGRRAPPVHDPVRLRRLRSIPSAEGARARVRGRLDRLLARPHRRRVRPHLHRHPCAR